MGRFSLRRVALVFAVVGAVWAGQAIAGSDATGRYADVSADEQVVPPRENGTVVTTSPWNQFDGKIVAFAPNGSVLYYSDRYYRYFDVDLVPGTRTTVEYVAETRLPCPISNETCNPVRYVRTNLTTGTSRIVHEFAAVGRSDWHDIDRISEDRLLVADIQDRLFMVDTSTGNVTWEYHFRRNFNRSQGGLTGDWTHLNDVERLADGRTMASPRNMDQVVFIERGSGVNDSWTLGSDGEHETLLEPHNPDYIPASRGGPAVVIGDSGNNRVVEYQRTNGSWRRTWEWQDRRMSWPRDADRLPNGHTLITDSNGNRVMEVAEDGSIVWQAPINTPYEAERLGTGSESAGGRSAASLGLDTRTVAIDFPPDSFAGFVLSATAVAVEMLDLLPDVVVNGLLFVLPPSVTRPKLAVFLLSVFGTAACAVGWFWLDAKGVPGAVRERVTVVFSRDR